MCLSDMYAACSNWALNSYLSSLYLSCTHEAQLLSMPFFNVRFLLGWSSSSSNSERRGLTKQLDEPQKKPAVQLVPPGMIWITGKPQTSLKCIFGWNSFLLNPLPAVELQLVMLHIFCPDSFSRSLSVLCQCHHCRLGKWRGENNQISNCRTLWVCPAQVVHNFALQEAKYEQKPPTSPTSSQNSPGKASPKLQSHRSLSVAVMGLFT